MKLYTSSLMIFTRDFRLDDNTALIAASLQSTQVMPCFIFDPAQITPHPYQSKPGLQFMLQCIQDLQAQLLALGGTLQLFYAPPEQVITLLSEQHKINAVFMNRDYTPFSRNRQHKIKQQCESLEIDFHSYADILLTEPEQILKKDGSPYQVFTAFYKQARQLPVAQPALLPGVAFMHNNTTLHRAVVTQFQDNTNLPNQTGGRSQALALLDKLEDLQDYQIKRDFPALDKTTRLSAHLKFGSCSVRSAYHALLFNLGPDHPLLRQLYWRDFFYHVAYHNPEVFGQPFHQQYASLQWHNDPVQFNAWTTGNTGFPIIDAGMRELNQTGFMHNRVRMLTAAFLVKDLHIDWRWGERYFAEHLADYDPCVNNGNWQWAASTGCDAQPYFRIFNPWLQQQKFDPDCRYIYRWIPELKNIPANIIHQWESKHTACDYPKPMINHSLESKIAKQLFKSCRLAV